MNTRFILVGAILLGMSSAHTAGAAQCAGGGARPAWVDSPESVTDDYFLAAGVSDDVKAVLADRIASAKQSALRGSSRFAQNCILGFSSKLPRSFQVCWLAR